jgi:hypothetical protein
MPKSNVAPVSIVFTSDRPDVIFNVGVRYGEFQVGDWGGIPGQSNLARGGMRLYGNAPAPSGPGVTASWRTGDGRLHHLMVPIPPGLAFRSEDLVVFTFHGDESVTLERVPEAETDRLFGEILHAGKPPAK